MEIITFMVYVIWFCFAQDLVFCDDYGESGNIITLTPIIRGKPEEILWTHNGNKVLEYNGSAVVKYGSFKDRVDTDFETGELTIRNLNSQDSGKYQSKIWINGEAQISSHTLTVLEESQTQPSYEWSTPDIKQPEPTLEEKCDSVRTCTVKNTTGNKITDFTHTDRVSPAMLVPVLIVSVLLNILLAVLVLYLYRCKKQKSRGSEQKKMDTENGECDNLLRNLPMETMPGECDNLLGNASVDAMPGELDENEKSGKIADEAEENSNRKTNETQSQKTEDADKNENHQTPKEKKEKEGEKKETDSLNKETVSPQPAVTERSTMDTGNIEDSPNKGSSDATLTAPKESSADKKCDQDSGSENATHEEEKEKEKENKGTDSQNTGELDENEKSGKIANEAEENSNGKTDETQSQKTEDADKHENHQTPKEKKEKEGEKKETDSPNKETVSPQPVVTERSTMDTGNVEELQHTNENNSQNENGKLSSEQQKRRPSTAINKDDQEGEEENALYNCTVPARIRHFENL
ncbi:hypothetical protein QQF64_034147 [Cirrhinus molitorella]|uniref:Uncharacterized protein n=1 Tax=Cirrhinus molitorella TaxID=172907 RepID=A0ABR3MVZ6_9TELE